MDHRRKQTIGYELVKASRMQPDGTVKEYHSFRIHGPSGRIIPGMDCPLVFDSPTKAKACAEQLIAHVAEQLKKLGKKVEAHTG